MKIEGRGNTASQTINRRLRGIEKALVMVLWLGEDKKIEKKKFR